MIERFFNVPVFDYYGATESGPIAFQCRYRSYHIFSDLIHLEIIKDRNISCRGNTGRVIITKLYGGGTPVIRYTGLDDVITISNGNCRCGISGEIIEKIHGRKSQIVILPNGNILYPVELEKTIDEIIYKRRVFNICGIRFLQRRFDEIVIFVVIDDDRDKYGRYFVDRKKLLEMIKSEYQKLFGRDVEVTIKELDRLKPGNLFVESRVNPYRF